MSEAIEKYINDARASGMDDTKIKEMLEKAGWVSEQIDPILSAIPAQGQAAPDVAQTQAQPAEAGGAKQHFSIRKLPDLFMDYVWNKIF